MKSSYLTQFCWIPRGLEFHVFRGEADQWHGDMWHDATWHHVNGMRAMCTTTWPNAWDKGCEGDKWKPCVTTIRLNINLSGREKQFGGRKKRKEKKEKERKRNEGKRKERKGRRRRRRKEQAGFPPTNGASTNGICWTENKSLSMQ